jgi:hypothetical protein
MGDAALRPAKATLTIPRALDTIDECTLKFWAKFQASRLSPQGLESAKSPACGAFMGGAIGANARELRASG